MRKWNKILVSALLMAMLTVQSAWATGTELVQPGWVNMELGPAGATWVEGESEANQVNTAGESAAEEMMVSEIVGDQSQAPSAGTVEAAQQTPPGGTSADTSRVVVAGQSGMQQEAAGPSQEARSGQTTDSGQTETESSGVLTVGEGMQQGGGTAQAEQQGEQQTEVQDTGRQIDPNRPMVALTYDDGPQPSVGNRIMDCLAQYDGKATFFMVGDRVPSHAAEVQRMVAEGHEVANHSMNHKYLQKLGADEIQAQVVQCNDVIQAVSGVRPTLMRLPGGNHNATVRANVNMPMIQWNIDTLDWKTRDADATVSSVLSQVKDGDIILMHELYSQTADATERLVPELVNRGFQLVTVSEMAAAKGVVPEAGKIYSAFH